MKRIWTLIANTVILPVACSDGEDMPGIDPVEPQFSEYEERLIEYFNELALCFEYGLASEVTRKWATPMLLFLEGDSVTEFQMAAVDHAMSTINSLATYGFSIKLVTDRSSANATLFLGVNRHSTGPTRKLKWVLTAGLFMWSFMTIKSIKLLFGLQTTGP